MNDPLFHLASHKHVSLLLHKHLLLDHLQDLPLVQLEDSVFLMELLLLLLVDCGDLFEDVATVLVHLLLKILLCLVEADVFSILALQILPRLLVDQILPQNLYRNKQ